MLLVFAVPVDRQEQDHDVISFCKLTYCVNLNENSIVITCHQKLGDNVFPCVFPLDE